MLTKEQIENKIRNRLLDGRGQAEDMFCAYRDRYGRGCAVGCLIDDEHYSINFEGIVIDPDVLNRPASDNVRQFYRALRLSGIPTDRDTLFMLEEWQKRHDRPDNWDGDHYIGPLHSVCAWEQPLR